MLKGLTTNARTCSFSRWSRFGSHSGYRLECRGRFGQWQSSDDVCSGSGWCLRRVIEYNIGRLTEDIICHSLAIKLN
jgi:hypothetical protein